MDMPAWTECDLAEIERIAGSISPMLKEHLPDHEHRADELAERAMLGQLRIKVGLTPAVLQQWWYRHSNTQDIKDIEANLNALSLGLHRLHWQKKDVLWDHMGGDEKASRVMAALTELRRALEQTAVDCSATQPAPRRPAAETTPLILDLAHCLRNRGAPRAAVARFLAALLVELDLPARTAKAIEQTIRDHETRS